VVRGHARALSDVDVLFVCSPRLPITRALYDSWDEQPMMWDGHLVEPHFVRLREADERISGLWAEVAVDRIAIFDPELILARHLREIRHRIMDGEVVRRTSQAHSYWSAP
jgi:hypothetical protein